MLLYIAGVYHIATLYLYLYSDFNLNWGGLKQKGFLFIYLLNMNPDIMPLETLENNGKIADVYMSILSQYCLQILVPQCQLYHSRNVHGTVL